MTSSVDSLAGRDRLAASANARRCAGNWDRRNAGDIMNRTNRTLLVFALSVVVATMVSTGLLDWRGVARVIGENPARIVGLDDQGRPLEVGQPANLVIVHPAGRGTTPWAAIWRICQRISSPSSRSFQNQKG